MAATMRVSARIAIEELMRKGWHELADDAEEKWQAHASYWPSRKIDRYTAALITAANWDIEHDNHARRHRAA